MKWAVLIMINTILTTWGSGHYTPYEGPTLANERAGSWVYLAKSWRKATPHCVSILINVNEKI